MADIWNFAQVSAKGKPFCGLGSFGLRLFVSICKQVYLYCSNKIRYFKLYWRKILYIYVYSISTFTNVKELNPIVTVVHCKLYVVEL